MNRSPLLALALLLTACGDDAATTASSTTGAGSGGASSATSSSTAATGGSSSASTTSSTAASTGSGSTDPCADVTPVCPGGPPTKSGDGLTSIDRCAFPMMDANTWAANDALVAALATKLQAFSLGDILLGDLNRTATSVTAAQLPGAIEEFRSGFEWEAGDESVQYWIPQGLTVSADSTPDGAIAGKKVALVSFYYDKAAEPGSTIEKGVRIAIVDTTISTALKYRFVLLVEPVAGNPASFKAVKVHAGGLAWFGHYLYVVDTGKGFRVFDTNALLEVATSQDSIGHDASSDAYYAAGYKYVMPQVGAFTSQSTCKQLFSFVSVDRSTDPPSLLSGEYCTAPSAGNPNPSCGALDGRLFRYPLGADGRLTPGQSWPSAAYYQGETQVQGALSYDKKYFLSSSAPAGGAGALFVMPEVGPSETHAWIDAPEDLAYDPVANRLWGLSEAEGARFVFAVDPSGY